MNNKFESNRDKIIDIIKCIGIILMVLGHSGFIFTRWIYQFHMAVFFIVAGFCFKEKYFENFNGIKNLIINRIKTLYIPCLTFNTFIVVFHNLFVKIHLTAGDMYSLKDLIIHLLKCFLFSGGESLSGAMWFLRTMFLSTIIFCLVLFFTKKSKCIQIITCLLLTCVGYLLSSQSFGKYFNFLSVIILFEIGFLIKNKFESIKSSKKGTKYILVIVGLIGTILPMIFVDSSISLKSNSIVNPVYFILCSTMGFALVCGLANIIDNFKIRQIAIYIGNHTLSIVMFHYLAMKLVTLLGIVYYGDEIKRLAEYPFAYTGNFWCFLYTIVGITVPLVLYKIYTDIRGKINVKNLKNNF